MGSYKICPTLDETSIMEMFIRPLMKSTIANRTGSADRKGRECPICTNRTLLTGFTDLLSTFPILLRKPMDGILQVTCMDHTSERNGYAQKGISGRLE